MKENQHIEWKESWRDEYLKWICGFANAEGGVLLIGRNDKGRVVGIADAGKLLEELPNKVRDPLGIQRIFQACRDAGTPQPKLRLAGHDLWLEFAFASEYLQAVSAKGGEPTPKAGGTGSGKTSGKMPERIVALMQAQPGITIPEIARRLKRTTRAIEMQVNKLKADEVIGRVGPAKGGHWEVLK